MLIEIRFKNYLRITDPFEMKRPFLWKQRGFGLLRIV